MAKEQIIAGLDLGSTTMRIAVAQKTPEQKLQFIGAVESPANGISKGVINSVEDVTSSLSDCLEKVERLTGFPVSSVWVGVSGPHIKSQISRGVVAVSKSNGEVTEEDVDRAIEAARTVATPPNYEILHVIPKNFTVDSQNNIKDPVGMSGIRLEVEAQIIQGLSAQIKNLTKVVYRTGLDIEDLVLSVLATAEAVATPRQKELGVALINIGGPTTSLAVFEERDLLHTAVLPIGSDHITGDIAIGLRTSLDTAERIKLDHGTALAGEIGKREEIDLTEIDETETEKVSRKYVADIIEARVEEIFEHVEKELQKIDRSGMLPAGIIITGSGAKLPGLIEVAKKKLRLPASLGYPLDIISAVDKTNDLSFSTAVGLVLWGAHEAEQRGGSLGNFLSRFRTMDKAPVKIKKWFKSMLP